MVYNMTVDATLSMNMTALPVNTSSYNMGPTPSGVNMTYTASANVTVMNYNSSVWPTPSASIPAPFFCPNVSCWEEIECRTRKL